MLFFLFFLFGNMKDDGLLFVWRVVMRCDDHRQEAMHSLAYPPFHLPPHTERELRRLHAEPLGPGVAYTNLS